jgi:putative transposase
LTLTAATHHEQIRADRRIGYDALFSGDEARGQIPGQLCIDDLDNLTGQNGASA